MRTIDEIQKEIDSLVLNLRTQEYFYPRKISLQLELLIALLRSK